MMKLPPNAVCLDEPARRADAKIEAHFWCLANALLAPNEEMPIATALTCEIVESDLNGRRPVEQLRISLADRQPPASYAAYRIVHARRIPVRPISGEPIEISGVERSVKVDQGVERATVVGSRLCSGDLGQIR